MSDEKTMRLPLALLTFVAWVLATLFSMRWASDGAKKELVDTVTHGVSWNIVIAIVVLAAATFIWRWRDLKFVAPLPQSSLKLLWFPLLYFVVFAVVAFASGLPPASVMAIVFVNTLLVGLSEEWMFRGVMFQGLRSRLQLWPAMIITTLLFGSVHVLNVFVTGKLGEGVLQATTAAMSGLVFIALLVRTGSIWVPIIYHGLWDFFTFVMSSSAGTAVATAPLSSKMSLLLPLALVLPNFLYALFLLRRVRNDTRLSTD